MRTLFLSDLHRKPTNRIALEEQDRWLEGVLSRVEPEAVVIPGDIFEAGARVNPYEALAGMFGDIPVICTLGNHEFYRHTVREVLDSYAELYAPEKWNVHFLDVVGAFDVGDIHFFGNVLWYDGSLSTVPGQVLTEFADGMWRDREIRDFDPALEHWRCLQQIMDNQPSGGQVGILCTHCVPHRLLNGHLHKTSNPFNAFSGVANMLNCVRSSYAICGHTHWRIDRTDIHGIQCWNIGNDYYPPFEYLALDLPHATCRLHCSVPAPTNK